MEDLIKDIQERTGLAADSIVEVVTMVTEYMKSTLRDDLGSQVSEYFGEAGRMSSAGVSEAASSATDMATGAAGTAAAAASYAMDAMDDLLQPRNEN